MSKQKDIGTRFELQVKDQLNVLLPKELNLTAIRIWYSGAGAREPFDVGIYRGVVQSDTLAMSIECKRTQGRSIGLLLEWLDLIGDRMVSIVGPDGVKTGERVVPHVVMFAVGMRTPIPVYVVHRGNARDSMGTETVIFSKPGAKSMAVHQKYVRKRGMPKFRLQTAAGRIYVVEPLESFAQMAFPKPMMEASND
jgi:hypothetical protein